MIAYAVEVELSVSSGLPVTLAIDHSSPSGAEEAIQLKEIPKKSANMAKASITFPKFDRSRHCSGFLFLQQEFGLIPLDEIEDGSRGKSLADAYH